jgi:hypothetical protein
MMTERMQHLLERLEKLPPEEQDRVAVAMQAMLDQAPVTSDNVRPEVMAAFEQVMEHSTNVLDYLQDK